MQTRTAVLVLLGAGWALAFGGVWGCTSKADKEEEERIKARAVDFSVERRAVAATLDTFHLAASRCDLAAYTGCFAPDLVFLGTDPTERWNAFEFTAFAKSYFDQKKGWTYTLGPRGRTVTVDPDGSTAWFDEELVNETYGWCRGTGVLRKMGGRWLISQYNLTFTVPNETAERVTQIIRAERPLPVLRAGPTPAPTPPPAPAGEGRPETR